MVDEHVVRDRPLVQLYPRSTFDDRVLPVLIRQAQELMPYVIRKAGIDDDKLPSEYLPVLQAVGERLTTVFFVQRSGSRQRRSLDSPWSKR